MRRFVEVNEAAIFATGTAASWWATFRQVHGERRITTLTASLGGDRVNVEVDDETHAREFVAMLIEQGVPRSAAEVVKAPSLGYEHSCTLRASVRCAAHVPGKPTTKKCQVCGGQWVTLRGTYGLFTWTGTGRYPIQAAHATYASPAKADAVANARPAKDWVVRFIDEGSL